MNHDFNRFLTDHNIPLKQGRRGFTDIQCPFCGDSGMHGGFHPFKGYVCFRCGRHPVHEAIMLLTGLNWFHVEKDYIDNSTQIEPELKPSALEVVLPKFTKPIEKQHKQYLISRHFNPNRIERDWNIMGTGHLGDFKFRIIIPIYHQNNLVSYLGRDITGRSGIRYRAPKLEEEVIHHKHILYGLDYCSTRHGVICEGATDVWRMGEGAVATLGTGFTTAQINIINKYFDSATLLYDSGIDAAKRAEELGGLLSGIGIETDMILLDDGDPGDLPQEAADDIMQTIFKQRGLTR